MKSRRLGTRQIAAWIASRPACLSPCRVARPACPAVFLELRHGRTSRPCHIRRREAPETEGLRLDATSSCSGSPGRCARRPSRAWCRCRCAVRVSGQEMRPTTACARDTLSRHETVPACLSRPRRPPAPPEPSSARCGTPPRKRTSGEPAPEECSPSDWHPPDGQ
jgi:hypothetical protein